MMAGHGDMGAGGGPARHIPVLLPEVLAALEVRSGETIIDGTFGAGGYTRAILEGGANVVAIDRDPTAIVAGKAMETEFDGRLRLVEGPFSQLDAYVEEKVDGVVLDIGVSSMQIDEADRGFSFRNDGPLDMRMSGRGMSAVDIVNTYKIGDLARVFGFLGEERQAGRIARMIEDKRSRRPFTRTLELADAIQTLVGRGPKDKIHPATRVFQALRIHVNDELGELARALLAAERALKPGGRLVVVTFHSLEDRIVKRFIADRAGKASGSRHLPEAHHIEPTFTQAGKVVAASDAEADVNPRARSAKLRAAVRNAVPPRRADFSLFGLPKLPSVGSDAEEAV
ncbi:16S rRNA (cytosine(1402)-N(4))-methyltransferase RsmH [Aliihoeflea sp. PC F10.4]